MFGGHCGVVTQQHNQQSVGQLLVSIFLWEGMLHNPLRSKSARTCFSKAGKWWGNARRRFCRAHHSCLFTSAERRKEIGERGHGDSSGFCSIGWINEATGGFSHIFSPRACAAWTHTHVHTHKHTHTANYTFLASLVPSALVIIRWYFEIQITRL